MTVIVAFILAGMNTFLKPIHDLNEAVYNQKSILQSISEEFDKPIAAMTANEVDSIFTNEMESLVIDKEGQIIEGVHADDISLEVQLKLPENDQKYPLYIFKGNGKTIYILGVRGQGLWDAIWGNVALNDDLKTIVGVSFDHAGETPGLGAEIKDNPNFPSQFKGKTIFDESGDFTSVQVVKGIVREPSHQVEGISGATITSDGVTDMLYKGIENYEPYLEKQK